MVTREFKNYCPTQPLGLCRKGSEEMASKLRKVIYDAYTFASKHPSFYVSVYLADIPYFVIENSFPDNSNPENFICCFHGISMCDVKSIF